MSKANELGFKELAVRRTITLPSGQHLSKDYYPKRIGLYPYNPKTHVFLSDRAIR
jgi:hypothetical protein